MGLGWVGWFVGLKAQSIRCGLGLSLLMEQFVPVTMDDYGGTLAAGAVSEVVSLSSGSDSDVDIVEPRLIANA